MTNEGCYVSVLLCIPSSWHAVWFDLAVDAKLATFTDGLLHVLQHNHLHNFIILWTGSCGLHSGKALFSSSKTSLLICVLYLGTFCLALFVCKHLLCWLPSSLKMQCACFSMAEKLTVFCYPLSLIAVCLFWHDRKTPWLRFCVRREWSFAVRASHWKWCTGELKGFYHGQCCTCTVWCISYPSHSVWGHAILVHVSCMVLEITPRLSVVFGKPPFSVGLCVHDFCLECGQRTTMIIS